MAVRAFNGTSDDITCSAGAAASMTYGTFAFLVKLTTSRTLENFAFSLLTAGSAALRAGVGVTGTGTVKGVFFNGADYDDTRPLVTSGLNRWLTCVVRKGTGSTLARWSIYDHTAATWYHATADDTTLANWTAIGGTGVIRLYDTDQWPALRIAARALWANTVKWSADASGDAAIVAAGLHTASSNWLAATPGLAHFFNQASTSDPVNDWVGSSNQTAIAGTSVINGDDPPGFVFDHDTGTDATINAAVIATTTTLPTASPRAGSTVSPAAIATTTTTPAATVKLPASITPGTIATSSTLPAAGVRTGGTAAPASIATSSTLPAASVRTSSTASPSAIGTSTTLPAPQPRTGSTVSPSAIATATALPAPSVSAGGNATIKPAAIATSATLPAPTLSTGSTLAPAAIGTTTAIPAPAASGSAAVVADTIATAVTLPAPAVAGHATVMPSAIATAATVPAPMLSTGVTITVAVIATAVAVPAPDLTVAVAARGLPVERDVSTATVRHTSTVTTPRRGGVTLR